MDKGYVKAKIKWLTHEQGGRTRIPTGETYAGTLSLTYNTHDLWSFFIKNRSALSPENEETVDMTLLVREMISSKLSPGNTFGCYEGSKLVGSGAILND